MNSVLQDSFIPAMAIALVVVGYGAGYIITGIQQVIEARREEKRNAAADPAGG